mgnify:FL=1
MRTCVNGLIDRLNINNSSYDWMPRYNHTIRTVPDTPCQLVYPALFFYICNRGSYFLSIKVLNGVG